MADSAVNDASAERFEEAVRYFHEMIAANAPGRRAFAGFREGVIWAEEGYKIRLAAEARRRLEAENWREAEIGSGSILARTLAAIEIAEPDRNNLLEWEGRNGPAANDHRALVTAQGNPIERRVVEELLFRLYRGADDDEALFKTCVERFGQIFPLMGYLWFLRDPERFVPVRPVGLQQGLRRSGIDMPLAGRCSWQTYQNLIVELHALRPRVAAALSLEEVDLLEAHSFVWVVGNWTAPAPGQSSKGHGFGDFEKAAYIMARNVMATVGAANGQVVERRVKAKDTDMNVEDLQAHVLELLRGTGGACAVTDLPMILPPGRADPDMVASPDRINSDQGYVAGNIRLVCWFVNRWKGDDDPQNFDRLVEILRSAPMAGLGGK